VFRAYDAERERLVAVKLFKLDLPPERVHQLVAEFERIIAADLVHPALALPLAAGIHDVCAYLVQDYVAADSLDLVVREYGPAPAADALRVAAQLAGALDFAAAVTLTHGALHPRDVLLSSDDTRLTGVGIARAIERAGVAAPVRRPYTPPERIAGAAWDRRADVFSLAALMHELLWARRVSGLGAQAVKSLTEIPGGDPSALRATFARALADDPAQRFETALEFADALKNAFPDVTAAPAPAPAPSPAPAAPRRAARKAVEPQLPLLDPPSPERSATEAPYEAATHERPAQHHDVAQPVRAATDPAEPDLALSIAAAEEQRYRDVEVAPSIVELEIPREQPPAGILAPLVAPREPAPEMLSTLERARSSNLPIVLALGVGLMIGFAAGFGVGTREHAAPAAAAAAPPAAVTPPVAAGREFTENAVADAPKPAPDAAAAAAAGAAAPRAASAVRTPHAAVETGRLLVRSTPAGARLFVDGKEYGRTPAVVRDLARGSHRVRLVRDGYVAEERRVAITPSRPAQSMTVPLSRARSVAAGRSGQTAQAAPPATAGHFTGGLTIVSRPAGADVFMDGKHVGTTPVSLPAVSVGSHAIRLERDGYRRWTSSVRVVASEQSRVTASLEK
jgi:serine/threonine-protein kinase